MHDVPNRAMAAAEPYSADR